MRACGPVSRTGQQIPGRRNLQRTRADVAIGPDDEGNPKRGKEGATEACQHKQEITNKRGIKCHDASLSNNCIPSHGTS